MQRRGDNADLYLEDGGGKSQRLRYCPLCAKEDAKRYGEAYWHTLHQLPLVSVCGIHRCSLIDASSEPLRLNEGFYPLTAPEAACGISAEGDSSEILLAKLSREYLETDFKVGPTQKYNNLAQALLNQGYGVLKKGGVISLDAEKLYMQLSNFYGNAIVKRIFGSEASVATLNRIVKWNLSSPERYIMLQGLAGISIETMFSEVQIPDKMKLRLLDLQATGITYGKKQLAEQLGVKTYQLDILARNYGIKPFWKDAKCSQTKTEMLKIYLTEQERTDIQKQARKLGFSYTGDYIKFCIRQQMDVKELR